MMAKDKFYIEYEENIDSYCVKEKTTGWFYPFETEIQAKAMCDKLNELSVEIITIPHDEELDLHIDFKKYHELIQWVNKTSKRLIELDEIYNEEFKIELQNVIEDKVDFKAIYGGNTEKIRKQYVDEQLADIVDEKKLLKLHKEDDLRKIEFLKHLIGMKTRLIGL